MRRLDRNGDLVAHTEIDLDEIQTSIDFLDQSFIDHDGRTVLVGRRIAGAFLTAIEPDGSVGLHVDLQIAGLSFGSQPTCLALHPDGDYLVGYGSPSERRLTRLQPDGTVVWSALAPRGGYERLAIGGPDEIYLATDGVNAARKLHRLAGDGTLLWSRTQPFSNDSYNQVWKAVPLVRPDGVVLMPGANRLRATSPDGVVLWVRQIGYTPDQNALDGNELVTLTSSSIRKHNANGARLWRGVAGFGFWSASRGLFIAEGGHVIANVSPYDTNAAAYTVAFAPDGTKVWEINYLDVRDRLGLDRISAAAAPNSTGALGQLTGAGSDLASSNDLSLVLRDLPPQTSVLLLASMSAGSHPMAGGSLGTLCLDGSIGRFLRPGELRTTNPEGSTSLAVDLGSLPSPTGSVAASAGQTWYFQAWHRDLAFTSNFTNSISVTLN